MKFEKVTNIVLWVAFAISIILVAMLAFNVSDDRTDVAMNTWITANLNWTYILLGAASIIAIVFAIVQTVTDKDSAKAGGIALVFSLIILAISYALASDAIPQFHGVEKFVADGSLTPSISKWVGTTLYATYVLLGLILVSIVGFGLKGLVSKN
ncbi:MAG: hypothetical protein ACK5IJ_08905 [Mangrovibacterium sp.]